MNELTCVFPTQEEYCSFKEKANTEGLFNSFFPMPEVLEGTISPHIEPDEFVAKVNRKHGTNYLSIFGVTFADDKWDADIAKQIMQNLKAFDETAYYNWYDWCSTKWGVKWDASNCTSKDLPDFNTIIFYFDTPWDTPEQFVRELSNLYPEAIFQMVTGSMENDNHYEFTCKNNKIEVTCSFESFKEAVECGKWGGQENWECLFEDEEV
jgi:hypothetical protein